MSKDVFRSQQDFLTRNFAVALKNLAVRENYLDVTLNYFDAGGNNLERLEKTSIFNLNFRRKVIGFSFGGGKI